MDAQADLRLCCSHMGKQVFSWRGSYLGAADANKHSFNSFKPLVATMLTIYLCLIMHFYNKCYWHMYIWATTVTVKVLNVVAAFYKIIWAASSEFGTYRLCEQRRFRRACASAQSRQNLRCSLIQAMNQQEPSHRKPDPWPLWMAEHAQLKFVMTECSKTQIRLTRPI